MTGFVHTDDAPGVAAEALDNLFWWMCDGARPSANAYQIVSGICERITAAGVPVDRFALFVYTLHPNIRGRRFSWTPSGGVEMLTADFSLFMTEEYHNNPLPRVIETGTAIRRRICDPATPRDYKILDELEADGFTDYLCQPLVFTTGEVQVASWSTRAPGGFSDAASEALERIRTPLARLTETYMLRLNAATLLSTYVGRQSGEEILLGRIRRGDTREIRAGIVFVDLKGFTELTNRHGGAEVMAILNRFYDAVAPGIGEEDGEILKFIGDGLLVIFPLGEDGEGAEDRAVARAVAAVEKGQMALAEAEAADGLGFRASVHLGTIQYGNIGSADRLDFTAIGPAVNLAARLLSKAAGLGADVVLSEAAAQRLEGRAASAGTVELKGFDAPQPVYTLAEK